MKPMNIEERATFLREYFDCLERWRRFDLDLALGKNGGNLPAGMEALQLKLAEMRDVYQERLPVLPLSRCPFSNNLVYHSIDNGGLDGLWWNYDAPVRPLENLPSTYFALDGAIKLGSRIEFAPFLCKPGAGIPGVLPRLLNYAGIKAVLSSLQIGPHQGYPVFYFAPDAPAGLARVNTWGTGQYTFVDQNDMLRWGECPVSLDDYDFALDKWIESGKLLWVAPGDEKATLHAGLNGCPYLGLNGRRELLRIERSRVWSGETY
ncbi:MAG: hypothetical protein PHO01_08490 [Desulfotomaculaceae bacterium]|nr:hypothetical protein [Desulfotomaculaceae bacterium]